jgi:hypothetical protein
MAFVDEDGNVKVNLEGPIVVPHPTRPGRRVYFNQLLSLGGLPIELPGEHAFLILSGGEEKKRVPLYVNEPNAGGVQ